MGRSTTPKYVLEICCSDYCRYTPMAWHVGSHYGLPGDGKPTVANINKWVTRFEESRISGANKHLGIALVIRATIILNDGSRTVVTAWTRHEQRKNEPMFQVIG